jgi:hypothetical protein
MIWQTLHAEGAIDDYFARHALKNDRAGISRTYVLRRTDDDPPGMPEVLGFYTLSMANAESAQLALTLKQKLPRYPMPVALIGRLAIDSRAGPTLRRTLAARRGATRCRCVVDRGLLRHCRRHLIDGGLKQGNSLKIRKILFGHLVGVARMAK